MSRRKGIALCYPYDESRLQKWAASCSHILAQPKLDGERCRAVLTNGHVQLLSSEGNEVLSVPHISEQLGEAIRENIELDGELYSHGLSFPEIHSIVGRTTNLHPDYETMQYHIFDIVNPELDQVGRILHIINLPKMQDVKCVLTIPILPCPEEVESFLSDFIADGYEGIILRHPAAFYKRYLDKEYRSPYLMKFKPGRRDVYKIINVIEEKTLAGTPKAMVGALMCESPDPHSQATPFKVSCGATSHEKKREWWERRAELPGRLIEVSYQHLTPYHVPRHGRVNLELDLLPIGASYE